MFENLHQSTPKLGILMLKYDDHEFKKEQEQLQTQRICILFYDHGMNMVKKRIRLCC